MLAEFGDITTDAAHGRVTHLDAVLARQGFDGFNEAVPAYVSLLVEFDPLVTDHLAVERALRAMLATELPPVLSPAAHEVLICYDSDLAPDLTHVAQMKGLSVDAVIAAHLSGKYSVFMYGFAPGYAYLAGVPPVLDLPRKPTAKRGVAAGSVIIAAAQCLITTLTMPTGWWIIGRATTQILRDDPVRPFLFDVGDTVRFRRISRVEFDASVRTV